MACKKTIRETYETWSGETIRETRRWSAKDDSRETKRWCKRRNVGNEEMVCKRRFVRDAWDTANKKRFAMEARNARVDSRDAHDAWPVGRKRQFTRRRDVVGERRLTMIAGPFWLTDVRMVLANTTLVVMLMK